MIPVASDLQRSEVIGDISFTQRELDILACLLSGKPAKIIGALLSIAPRTVDTHVQRIMGKLNCNSKAHIIDFIEHSSHYNALKQRYVDLLHDKDPSINIELLVHPQENNKPTSMLRRYGFALSCVAVLCFLIVSSSIWVVFSGMTTLPIPIRSDLPLPTKMHQLNRPQLLKQIDNKFKEQEGIQTVALVGIGGSGKTTLARQYTQTQCLPVVWEVAAETFDSLLNSFERFAYVLSKTTEEKSNIDAIRKIEKIKERIDKLLDFVKQKLRREKLWCIIFDNVENFIDIYPFFPVDTQVWGKGKVLITTRNEHLKDNPYINTNHAIHVEFLNDQEKLLLFTKIFLDTHQNQLDEKQKNEMGSFLTHIPPFPLDVSIAAYYIKNHKITYSDYINLIQSSNILFQKHQMDFSYATSDHAKIRYNIVTAPLKLLIKNYPKFIGLFLLVSMIEADTIPKDLLDLYKDKELADHFIHEISKHSLVTYRTNHSSNTPIVSIHRSTQENIMKYLCCTLSKTEMQEHINSLTKVLAHYTDRMIEYFNLPMLPNLLEHFLMFLRHENLLNEWNKSTIKIQLGRIAFYLRNYQQAQSYIEAGLAHKVVDNHSSRIACAYAYLGTILRKNGAYEQAKMLLEHSVELYRKILPQNHLDMGWPLLQLGCILNYFGHYELAKQMINKSLAIHQAHYGETHRRTAWCFSYLGDVYRISGDYKNAQSLYEKSLRLHEKISDYSYNRSSYISIIVNLGNIYNLIGDYKKSRLFLEEGYSTYKEKFPKDYHKVSGSGARLGNFYRVLGCYEIAYPLLYKSFMLSYQHYGKHHIHTAWIGTYLGQLNLERGNYTEAKRLLEESLRINVKYSSRSNIRTSWIFLPLANTYKYLGQLKKAETLLEECLNFYREYYGKSHIEYAHVLRELGHVYFFQERYDKAEQSIKQALEILQQNQHPEQYKCLEYLGELYIEKSKSVLNKKQEVCKKFRNQGRTYFKQALGIARCNFPRDSLHITRIKKKLRVVSPVWEIWNSLLHRR